MIVMSARLTKSDWMPDSCLRERERERERERDSSVQHNLQSYSLHEVNVLSFGVIH